MGLGISPHKLTKYKSIQSISDNTSSPHHSSQGIKSFDKLQNTTLDLQKVISQENIIIEEYQVVPSTTRVARESKADELHRRYLSNKISEVLLEIDSINKESKLYY